MKKFFGILLSVCLVLFATSASAKKKSNVSTATATTQITAKQPSVDERLSQLESEIKQLKDSKSSNSGFDKGFFIKSADGNNQIKFSWFAQIFYEFQRRKDQQDINTFGVRRSRALISGTLINPKFRFMILPEMTSVYTTTNRTTKTNYTIIDSGGDTANFTVTDADTYSTNWGFRLLNLWGEYSFSDAINIRFGEFLIPMHRQYYNAHMQQFPDYPMATNTEPFIPYFHTGVDIWGKIHNKKFRYDVFAVNGSGLDRANINKAMRLGARLSYDILGNDIKYSDADIEFSETPQLAIGAHGSYERADTTVAGSYARGDDIVRASADMLFKYKGFSFDPEAYFFYNHDQHIRHYGMAIQTGYFIIPKKFDVALEASGIWYDGPNNDRYDFGAGWNYYFNGHPIKMQMDYSLLWYRQPGSDVKDHRVRLGMEIGFF